MPSPAANSNNSVIEPIESDHPGFIHRSSVIYFYRTVATARHSVLVRRFWQNAIRPNNPARRGRILVPSTKARNTPYSETHNAIMFTANRVKPDAPGQLETSRFFVIEPRRAMLETTLYCSSAEEQKRVWDTIFERRFKENMIANRETVLRRSMHCALAAGLKVMFYYFDASKDDGDEGLFRRLHEEPLDLTVVGDQIEVERLIRWIAEHAWDDEMGELEDSDTLFMERESW